VLLLALRRADDLGFDPFDVLADAVDRRTVRTTACVAQCVALGIHRLLDARTGSAPQDCGGAWPHILRLLKRLENAGADPAGVLREALAVIGTGPLQPTLTALATQLRLAERRLDDPHLPAWLRAARPVDDPEWHAYLNTRARLIRRRVEEVAHKAATTRPAWTRDLGDQPTDPAGREQWLRHLAVIAAYRDQYQVQGDDPDHPLGPYPEHGRVGHGAYWIAAASLLALRGIRESTDSSWGRLAADRYRTLRADEQARIGTELARQLSSDWLGDLRDPATDADQPVYRDILAAILVEHGHLDEPGSEPVVGRVPRLASASARTRQRQDRQRRATKPHPQPESSARRTEAPQHQHNSPTQRLPQIPPDRTRGPRPGR
jgi:hypothetical protein